MKNTMKKLLSLVLVAMLLVSAIPFQASAASTGGSVSTVQVPVQVKISVNGGAYENVGGLKYLEVSVFEQKFGETEAMNLLENKTNRTFVKWGSSSSGDLGSEITLTNDSWLATELPKGYTVYAYFNETRNTSTAKNVTVHVYYSDNKLKEDKTITVDVGGITLSLERGKQIAGADVEKWSSTASNNVTNSSYTVNNCPDELYLYLKAASTDNAGSGSGSTATTHRVTFWDGNQAVKTIRVAAGATMDKAEFDDAQNEVGAKTGYTFKGWKINNTGDPYTNAQASNIAINSAVDFYASFEKNSTTGGSSNDGSTSSDSNKFPYKVYLHIFKDNKIDEPAKTINITDGIALDGKVTLDEVKTVVKNNYTAKTSDGIKYDGMYLAEGNWVGNFVNDTQKYDTIQDTNEMRKTREVHINVMITNANAKNAEKADTTNPKTGDTILVPVIFMLVSGSAIAAAYIYSKKRTVK
ncbi:MAG: hypothetical protein PUD80_00265 [Firmicutes bacterium]|nr:hypothetical protein [Bacillota bacterium]